MYCDPKSSGAGCQMLVCLVTLGLGGLDVYLAQTPGVHSCRVP